MTRRSLPDPVPLYPMPFTRVEVVTQGVVEKRLSVLLIRRTTAPYAGHWALPGGALRIDLDDSLHAAARRVLQERLGVEGPRLTQLEATGGPDRDPRAPWTLSVVYRALVPAAAYAPSAGKRVGEITWMDVDRLDSLAPLAFDHRVLIDRAVAAVRGEVDGMRLPFHCFAEHFTLGELQEACEQLLGRPLDKSSFRRRLADRHLVEPVAGARRGGAFRPAQ